MATDFDVVIAGGGLVGFSLALALSQQDKSVALIDAKKLVADAAPSAVLTKAIALTPASQCIFEQLGVWSDVVSMAKPIGHIHVSNQGHFGMTKFHADELDVPALGYVIEEPKLLTALINKVRDCQQVTLIDEAALEKISKVDEAHHLILQTSQSERVIHARLLVGADGTRSFIRDSLGITADEKLYQQVAIVSWVGVKRGTGQGLDWAYERFTPDGAVALLPLVNGRFALICTVHKDNQQQWLEATDEAFIHQLQSAFGYRAGVFTEVGPRIGYPISQVVAGRHGGAGCVLLGNALHTLHPIAGQGFNLALREAALLAELIVTANIDDLSTEDFVKRFEAQCQPHQAKTISTTNAMVEWFRMSYAPVILGRNLRMASHELVPGSKEKLAKKMMGLTGKLPKLVRQAL